MSWGFSCWCARRCLATGGAVPPPAARLATGVCHRWRMKCQQGVAYGFFVGFLIRRADEDVCAPRWLERLASVRCPGVSPGVRMREARRLRNGLARDAPATFPPWAFPQILMSSGSVPTNKHQGLFLLHRRHWRRFKGPTNRGVRI